MRVYPRLIFSVKVPQHLLYPCGSCAFFDWVLPSQFNNRPVLQCRVIRRRGVFPCRYFPGISIKWLPRQGDIRPEGITNFAGVGFKDNDFQSGHDYVFGCVMVSDVIAISAPATKATVLKLISSPDVPTVTSILVVPPDVAIRAHVAVPVASALVSDVIAAAVSTPFDAAGKAAALNVSVASSVCAPMAVSASVGIVPV